MLTVLSAGVHQAYLQYREDPELKRNFRCEVEVWSSGGNTYRGVFASSVEYCSASLVRSLTSCSLTNAARAAGFYNDLAVDFLSETHAPVSAASL